MNNKKYALIEKDTNIIKNIILLSENSNYIVDNNHYIELFDSNKHKLKIDDEPIGFKSSVFEFELGITEEDQLQLTKDLMGILNNTDINNNTILKIKDKFGNFHEVTVENYRISINEYWYGLRSLWESGQSLK